MDCVGHALALAGTSPAFCRSSQNVHLKARPSSGRLSITPNGQETTQYPQPLHISGCTKTEPTSVRTIEPVGQASRHPALAQCLQTSERNCQRNGSLIPASCEPICCFCSKKSTCRQVEAPKACVLSYESPDHEKPSSGTSFHSLQAT